MSNRFAGAGASRAAPPLEIAALALLEASPNPVAAALAAASEPESDAGL